MGRDPGPGGRQQVVDGGHDLVDEAELQGRLRVEPLPLQEHARQRGKQTEEAHRADDAPSARKEPERDLGEADPHGRQVGHDPVVAGERELEAAAEGGSVDRGDDRSAERLERAHRPLERGDVLHRRGGGLRPVRHPQQVPQVAAGEERLLRRGEDDAADGVLLGDEPVDGGGEGGQVVGVHRVGRLARVVHGQDDDAVGTLVVADGVGVGCVDSHGFSVLVCRGAGSGGDAGTVEVAVTTTARAGAVTAAR
jgi:hypothetical protein